MVNTERFRVQFWGVRGSYPTPGPQTIRYGGNTTCVEVTAGNHTLILDAGSGIIRLGKDLLHRSAGRPFNLSLFITHGHSDHLLGFPFFAPLYERRATIDFFGPGLGGRTLEQLVTPFMSPPYFPVEMGSLPSHRIFHTISEQEQIVWSNGELQPTIMHEDENVTAAEVRIVAKLTNSHPLDGAVIYRIEYAGRRLVFATDVEWREEYDPGFLDFVKGADLLIHDAQYTHYDYEDNRQGFGHSTIDMATGVANAAHVHKLILFHHEPTYDDNKLDYIQSEARLRFMNTSVACEGMEINLL
jgi:phosphoribosyl 1,2-cyclic phosphodiesterase